MPYARNIWKWYYPANVVSRYYLRIAAYIEAPPETVLKPRQCIHPSLEEETMTSSNVQSIIEAAIKKTAEMNPQETDGDWLEVVTAESGPYIKEWDIGECWRWDKWPDREVHFPDTTRLDVGIDVVAVRRSDGEYIAIQCKSRQLDEQGHGGTIPNNEIAKFAAAAAGDFWAERWVVTNGDNPLASGAQQSASMHGKPLKLVNITTTYTSSGRLISKTKSANTPRQVKAVMSEFRRRLVCRTKLSPIAFAYSGNKNARRAADCL